MKTLVVDDDLTSRMVLEAAMSPFGGVETCTDGAEAVRAARLALAQGDPYDLICMDILMPTMNGLEALQLIRQEEAFHGRARASKVIVITAREDEGSIGEAFGQFCDAYVVKPIEQAKFLNVVACLCEIRELKPD